MPPLRERGEDLIQLADKLLARLAERHRLPAKRLSRLGQQRIRVYPWPGNVRELANELERALVFEEGEMLDLGQLLAKGGAAEATASGAGEWLNAAFVFPEQGFVLEEAIARLIRRALKQAGGNVSGAARLLGVTRDFVRYRLAEQRGLGGGESPNDCANEVCGPSNTT
jgi:DNA-binding NtrC family response regulator